MWIYILIVIASVLGYLFFQHSKNPLKHIPGPKGLPFVGNVFELASSVNYVQISDWAKIYGPIFKFSMFSKQMVVITGTDALKEAMLEQGEDFAGRAPFYRAAYLTDNYEDVVFCSYNERVKLTRKFIHTNLHIYGTGLNRMETITLDELQDLICKLTEKMGLPIDPTTCVHETTLAIMYIVLFGKKPDKDGIQFKLLLEASRDSPKALGFVGSGILLDMMPWLRFFGNSAYKILTRVRQHYHKLYVEAKQQVDDGDESGSIVHAMIRESENKDSSFGFRPVHIKNLILDMMGAGTFTTLSSFGSLFNILVHNRGVQEALQQEVDKGVGSGRYVQLSDQDSMPYTLATIIELIRYVLSVK